MDMATTTTLMSVGMDQAGLRPMTSDQNEVVRMSFAKSFDEEVGSATKATSEEGAIALRDFSGSAPLKTSGELAAAGAGSIVAQAEMVAAGGKSKAEAKPIGLSAMTSSPLDTGMDLGKKLEKTFDGVGVDATMNHAAKDEVAQNDLATSTDFGADAASTVRESTAVEIEGSAEKQPSAMGDVLTVAGDVATQTKVRSQDEPLVLPVVDGPAGSLKKTVVGKTEPVVSTKKSTRSQEQKATHARTLEITGSPENVAATVASMILGGAPVAVVVSTPAVAAVESQSNESAKTSKGNTGKMISSAVRGSEGSARSAVADKDAKAVGKIVPGSVAAALPAEGAAGSAMEGTEIGKSVALAAVNGADGDAKAQRDTASAGATHGAAMAGLAAPGWAPGVAAAHGVAGVASAKLQTQDIGAQVTTALHAGHGEPDGSSAALSPAMNDGQRMLTATPTTLEVGIANGTHGWLKVRAEMATGGGVNASLSAASPAGQEMLHRELPSLTAYLQQEQVAVNAVVVHPSVAENHLPGMAGGMGGDANGQAQQRSGQGGDGGQGLSGQGPRDLVLGYPNDTAYGDASRVDVDGLLLPVTYAGGGSWLSVRA